MSHCTLNIHWKYYLFDENEEVKQYATDQIDGWYKKVNEISWNFNFQKLCPQKFQIGLLQFQIGFFCIKKLKFQWNFNKISWNFNVISWNFSEISTFSMKFHEISWNFNTTFEISNLIEISLKFQLIYTFITICIGCSIDYISELSYRIYVIVVLLIIFELSYWISTSNLSVVRLIIFLTCVTQYIYIFGCSTDFIFDLSYHNLCIAADIIILYKINIYTKTDLLTLSILFTD